MTKSKGILRALAGPIVTGTAIGWGFSSNAPVFRQMTEATIYISRVLAGTPLTYQHVLVFVTLMVGIILTAMTLKIYRQ